MIILLNYVIIDIGYKIIDDDFKLIDEIMVYIVGMEGVKVVYLLIRFYGELVSNFMFLVIKVFGGDRFILKGGIMVMI